MTRRHITEPVWDWHCDRCGRRYGAKARRQQDLPTPAAMRSFGWFIAEKWGDLCSRCRAEQTGGLR